MIVDLAYFAIGVATGAVAATVGLAIWLRETRPGAHR
jgi:hypothetical protein